MIARLTGILAEASFTEAIVDVNGVGYQVLIPISTYDALPQVGEKVVLQIHTSVREDAITLFGFATEEEKKMYELLLTASGVGPKLALNILSSMPVANFCAAICERDLTVINKINGVGKRTAERLIVELHDKISKLAPGFTGQGATTPDAATAQIAEDALLALESLGFKRDAARKAIQKILENISAEECSIENLIRRALSTLNS
jgi:Holliday junction DNA helicase RuvA